MKRPFAAPRSDAPLRAAEHIRLECLKAAVEFRTVAGGPFVTVHLAEFFATYVGTGRVPVEPADPVDEKENADPATAEKAAA